MQVCGLGHFTHRKEPLYPWKLARPGSWSKHFGEEKIFCSALFQALGHPACSLVTILTAPSHSENVKIELSTPSYNEKSPLYLTSRREVVLPLY
jgi:hypothetical protein